MPFCGAFYKWDAVVRFDKYAWCKEWLRNNCFDIGKVFWSISNKATSQKWLTCHHCLELFFLFFFLSFGVILQGSGHRKVKRNPNPWGSDLLIFFFLLSVSKEFSIFGTTKNRSSNLKNSEENLLKMYNRKNTGRTFK